MFMCFSAAETALGTPGILDPSFGFNGLVSEPGDGFEALAIRPDGSSIAALTAESGTTALRFVVHDLSGNLVAARSASFPGTGIVGTTSVVSLPDGGVVAAGYWLDPFGEERFVVARWDQSLQLDATFDGDGRANVNVPGNEVANAVGVLSDGRIVLAGFTQAAVGQADVALAMFNPDGSIDATFGTGGIVILPLTPGGNDEATGLVVQPDDKIVIAGNAGNDLFVARLNSNGSLDGSFATGGVLRTSPSCPSPSGAFARDVALQPDGSIVVAGQMTGCGLSKILVARYTSAGAPDSSFGTAGVALTELSPGNLQIGRAVAIQANGRIVVGAVVFSNLVTYLDFALLRYRANGTLDTTFNSTGYNVLTLSPGDNTYDVALQQDGRILLAGTNDSASSILFRFQGDAPAVCGDGVLAAPPEGCDDGNTTSGDGCSATCGVEIRDGDVLVSQRGVGSAAPAILRVDPVTGVQSIVAEGGSLADPKGLAAGPYGTVYVADSAALGGTGAILRIAPSTGSQTVVSSGGSLSGANDVLVEADGNLIVINGGGASVVVRIDPDTGVQTHVAGGNLLTGGRSGAIAADGAIYVFDNDTDRIVRVDRLSGAQTLVTSGNLITTPGGIALEASGSLVAADRDAFGGGGGVYRVNAGTGAQTTVGSGGAFTTPIDIAVEESGNLVVADLDAFSGAGGVLRVNAVSGAQSSLAVGGLIAKPIGVAVAHLAACGDGVTEGIEQCDDGNTTSGDCCSATCQTEAGAQPGCTDANPCTADVCSSGICTHPAGNAGAVCRSAADVCDVAELCSGASTSCPADGRLPDADGDLVCDALDSCTNVAGARNLLPSSKPKLVVGKINLDTTPGNDKLLLQGEFILPGSTSFADIDPVARGARIVLQDADHNVLIDQLLPAGTYTGRGTRGWKGLAPVKWQYYDKTGAPLDGFTKVQLFNRAAKAPNQVKIIVQAKDGTFPVLNGDQPLTATLVLGNQSDAAAGRCTQSAFAAPECTFNGALNQLSCKQ